MCSEDLIKAMSQIIIESYRFKRTFERLVQKMDISEKARYLSQIAWYDKKLLEISQGVGLCIVNLDGQKYDEGMAITPINIDEFNKEDILYIEQMIEPIIMVNNKIYKTGTAVLGRFI